MAIGEILGAMLVLKADVSDLRAKLKTVTADEKAMVKAQIESAEARNKSIEKAAAGLAKLSAGIGVVTAAFKIGADAFKAYEETSRLQAASSKYNLDRLRSASAGLRTDLDLMRLAQKASGAQFNVSQGQLEDATKAMRAFEAAGFEGAKVQELVGQALLKGSIEPLKELGVNLEAAKGKTGQMSQLMEVLGQKSRQAGAGINAQTDEFRKAGVEYKNALNKIETEIGKIVIALGPLISALADVLGLVSEIASSAKGGTASNAPIFSIAGAAGGKYGYGYGAGANDQFAGAGRVQTQLDALDASRASQVNAILSTTNAIANSGFKPPQPRKSGGGGKKKDEPLYFITNERTGEIIPVYAPFATGSATGQDFGFQQGNVAAWGAGSAGPSGDMLASASAGMGADRAAELAKQAAGYGAYQAGKQQTMLEGIFGPLEQFDAYSTAFGMLTTTLTAGFDAWASGSMSAAEAMKKALGGALAAAGSQMFIEGLKHTAYAIGSLAFGDIRGAGQHAAAAVAFGVGAAAAGGAARLLGGGGATGTASAGAGGRAPSVIGGGAAAGGPTVNNYYVGDYMSPGNAREQAPVIQRAVRMANRESAGNETVRFS